MTVMEMNVKPVRIYSKQIYKLILPMYFYDYKMCKMSYSGIIQAGTNIVLHLSPQVTRFCWHIARIYYN